MTCVIISRAKQSQGCSTNMAWVSLTWALRLSQSNIRKFWQKGSIVLWALVKRIGVSRESDFHWISLLADLVYYQQCPSVCANGKVKGVTNADGGTTEIMCYQKRCDNICKHHRFSVPHLWDFLNIPIFWCACFVISYKVSTLVMSEYFWMIQPPFLGNIYSHIVCNEWSNLLFLAILIHTLYAMKITTCVATK